MTIYTVVHISHRMTLNVVHTFLTDYKAANGIFISMLEWSFTIQFEKCSMLIQLWFQYYARIIKYCARIIKHYTRIIKYYAHIIKYYARIIMHILLLSIMHVLLNTMHILFFRYLFGVMHVSRRSSQLIICTPFVAENGDVDVVVMRGTNVAAPRRATTTKKLYQVIRVIRIFAKTYPFE